MNEYNCYILYGPFGIGVSGATIYRTFDIHTSAMAAMPLLVVGAQNIQGFKRPK